MDKDQGVNRQQRGEHGMEVRNHNTDWTLGRRKGVQLVTERESEFHSEPVPGPGCAIARGGDFQNDAGKEVGGGRYRLNWRAVCFSFIPSPEEIHTKEEEMRKAILLLAALLVCLPVHAGPKWHWFKDKKLWLSFALIGGSIVADVETTQMARGRGAQEGNPLFGPQPGRLRSYATSIALDAPLLIGTYLSRKWKHNHYWISFTAMGAGPHIGAALWNSHVCRPSCK